MSVLIVTSVGDIVIDLNCDRCPLSSKNFLKLCKMKYYNGCLFHKVEKDFLAQTGDPTGTGTGGDSVYKFLYGEQARFFEDEIHPDIRHRKMGTVAMASAGKNCNASQFYFTLRDDVDYLDDKHTIFGIVMEKESLDTLIKINEAYVDGNGRPFKDIRIKHTYILDDPFDDPPQFAELVPENSPIGKPRDEIAEERLEDDWVPLEDTLGQQELEEMIRSKEAHTNAAILESVGDIPDAEIKPPDNVLFVCKLNPVTQDEDLFTIFSRFGTVTSAEIIRDYKTGDSLCYAFIEFETKEACERAYFKMDNCLIDDRRIHVDFSQSVAKLWGQFRQGKKSGKSKDGCFKCGSTSHIARDCDQGDPGSKSGTQKFVLKDHNTQRGDEIQRYDMVFDEDNNGHDKRERSKTRKLDRGTDDKVERARAHGNDHRRHVKGDEYRRDDECRSYNSEKHEDKYGKYQERSRAKDGDDNNHRSSRDSQREKDRIELDRDRYRNDRHDRHEDRRKRSRDGDHHKLEDGRFRERSKHYDDERSRSEKRERR